MKAVPALLLVVGLLWSVSLTVSATVINIPDDYPGIQAGIDAATSGDTVMVAPGRYLVNLNFGGKNICLKSKTGPLLTTLEPESLLQPIIYFANGETNGAKVVGFTIRRTRGNAAIRVEGSSPTIEGNIFTDIAGGLYGNNSAIYNAYNSQALIKSNIFWKNDSAYCIIWIGSGNAVVALNNTIHSGRLGIYLYGLGAMVKNNIVTGCQMGISANSTAPRGYNNVWGNLTDWIAGTPAATDISADPEFIDASSGNFALYRSSPCIDAGEDSAQYNSPDGTHNDIGAVQFDQTCPSINNMIMGEDISHLVNHSPTFYWSYYDTVYPEQSGFQLQVGTDNDWATAENWSFGPVNSPDTSLIYSGISLADGETYWWRLRVSNGLIQSAWKEGSFRMNTVPPPPSPLFPIGGEDLSIAGAILKIGNATDNESDILTYDFEVYEDGGLTILAASQYGLMAGDSITVTGKIYGLAPGEDYYWRARAFDGYEYSSWSATESFGARAPHIVHVPADYSTIQTGIDAAQELDTVLVAPGTYSGEGNRDLDFNGKNIKLISDGIGQVTIDCGGSPTEPHLAIYLHNDEDTSSLIDGFLITGAYSEQNWWGAVSLWAGATIRNCAVVGNISDGLAASAVAPNYKRYRIVVENCLFMENNNGIWAVADIQISNCRFINNLSDGLFLADMDTVSVVNSLFTGNGASGIHTSTGSWGNYSITNNTIVLNGKGLYFWYDPPKASETKAYSFELSHIARNLVAYNAETGIESDGLGFIGVVVECNNAFGNTVEDFHPGVPWGPYAGDTLGNISADPQFCDLDTAYSVSNLSPCLPENNSCGVMMGAYGIGCYQTEICGDANGNGTVGITDATYLLGYLYRGGPSPVPTLRAADVNGSGTLNMLDVTYLIAYLFKSGPPLQCPMN